MDGHFAAGLWHLAKFIILTQFMQTMLIMVDMYWVGQMGGRSDPHTGKVALAAVGVAGTIIWTVMNIAIGIVTGIQAIISRLVGEGRRGEADRALTQTALMIALLSTVLGAFGCVFARPLLKIMGPPEEVLKPAVYFMRIVMAGSTFSFLSFLFTVALQSAGDAKTPFRLALISISINMALDPLLIFGLGPLPPLGVGGAALATLIAQAVAMFMGLHLLSHGRVGLQLERRLSWPDRALMKDLLYVGVPGSFRMAAISISELAMTSLVAPFGTVALAAYTVGMRLRLIPMVVGFGLGRAAGVLVGQSVGAGKPERGAAQVWLATGLFAAFMAVVGTGYFVLARPIVFLFNSDSGVVGEGAVMLRITTLSYFFIGGSLILAKALEGVGDTRAPMVISILTLFGVLLPTAYFLSKTMHMGTRGLWAAITISAVLHGLLTFGYFRMGRWKKSRLSTVS